MSDREYWTKALRKAERELDAATRLSDVNAAAKRLMLAKMQLKRLELKAAGLTGGRDHDPAGAHPAVPFSYIPRPLGSAA
jgi:hypothetical protein